MNVENGFDDVNQTNERCFDFWVFHQLVVSGQKHRLQQLSGLDEGSLYPPFFWS